MTYSSWFFYIGLVKRSRYCSQLCTGIWIRSLISLSSTTKCMFIIAISTGISYFFDAKSWWLLLLCTKLCKVIAVLVLPGRESNTRLTAVRIRLIEKTTNDISEDWREIICLPLLFWGKKFFFRPINPICIFKKTLFKNSFQMGEKAHPFRQC